MEICIRCKLLFEPEHWDDNMCRECRGEEANERMIEQMQEEAEA